MPKPLPATISQPGSDPLAKTTLQGEGGPEEPAPVTERRSLHRVADDQQSGKGAASALSRLRMLERRRAELKPSPKS